MKLYIKKNSFKSGKTEHFVAYQFIGRNNQTPTIPRDLVARDHPAEITTEFYF